MNKTQEILKRINILIQQIAESIEIGDLKMGYVSKSTNEIDILINDLNKD